MREDSVISGIAALMGDPARASMLTALMDGRALTVRELAGAASVGLPIASNHLVKLDQAGLLSAEKQGRHRYFRLSGPDALASLMNLAHPTGAVRVRTGPKDAALRAARVCYGHLAGERAVRLMQSLVARGFIDGEAEPRITRDGKDFFGRIGIDLPVLEGRRRPLCRTCLDWSERRVHLGGALGTAVLDHILAKGWARRKEGRIVAFSAPGSAAYDAAFGLTSEDNHKAG